MSTADHPAWPSFDDLISGTGPQGAGAVERASAPASLLADRSPVPPELSWAGSHRTFLVSVAAGTTVLFAIGVLLRRSQR
ncbi:hypothetical protein [Subtercola boreus]|uniref:Uncharacterized protein n=1 Tax=Subtercola boreus TaxID=120213 RepID=A0A3E0WAH6_9MICO|nr:hypothetical protein [Subtercola boreus]RFA18800.1 hypothetical protein B7R24_13740 [Subtercola boreus]RFA18914.1 hypothetical protein B7R23_13730 [Subtercola boreus]RFA25452.1 hypothetical protein B7R25_13840 [Subtercola boreus]